MEIKWTQIKDTAIAIGALALIVATAYFTRDSLGVLLPLLTAVVSGSFAYYFSKKKELELKISEEKRIRYEKLIIHVKKGFFDKLLSDDERLKHKNEYYEQSYVVWLYASDEVIRHLNDFAIAFSAFSTTQSQENLTAIQQSLGKAVLAMRQDIRGNTTLQSNEFITTSIQPAATQEKN